MKETFFYRSILWLIFGSKWNATSATRRIEHYKTTSSSILIQLNVKTRKNALMKK